MLVNGQLLKEVHRSVEIILRSDNRDISGKNEGKIIYFSNRQIVPCYTNNCNLKKKCNKFQIILTKRKKNK